MDSYEIGSSPNGRYPVATKYWQRQLQLLAKSLI